MATGAGPRVDERLAGTEVGLHDRQEVVGARLRRTGIASRSAVPVAGGGEEAAKGRPLVHYVFPVRLPVHRNDRGYRISNFTPSLHLRHPFIAGSQAVFNRAGDNGWTTRVCRPTSWGLPFPEPPDVGLTDSQTSFVR